MKNSKGGITRREFLKRSVIGASLAWTAPTIADFWPSSLHASELRLSPRIRPIPLIRNASYVVYVWYIEGANSRILVDAGCDETSAINIGAWKISLLDDGLARVGLTPEDIDIVIFTHLHPDHAGYAERFTNARLIVQSAELEDALKGGNQWYQIATLKLVKDIDFETICGDQQIDDHVRVLLTPGHTAGGQSVLVETSASKAVITGFCCTMGHFKPTIVLPPLPKSDPAQFIKSMQEVAEIADILIPLHDPSFIGIDTIPTEIVNVDSSIISVEATGKLTRTWGKIK